MVPVLCDCVNNVPPFRWPPPSLPTSRSCQTTLFADCSKTAFLGGAMACGMKQSLQLVIQKGTLAGWWAGVRSPWTTRHTRHHAPSSNTMSRCPSSSATFTSLTFKIFSGGHAHFPFVHLDLQRISAPPVAHSFWLSSAPLELQMTRCFDCHAEGQRTFTSLTAA